MHTLTHTHPEQTDWQRAREERKRKKETFKTNYKTHTPNGREWENGGHVCQITLRENSQQPTAQSVVSEANKTKSG